jgi:hypothetical protein
MRPVNFGSARILVIVALIVAGVAILTDGFGHGVSTVGDGGGSLASPSSSATAQPTGGSTPSPPALPSPQAPKDVKIAVFNGTSTLGLAAQGQTILTDAGYVAAQDPANSPVEGVSKTVVYYRGGADADQNRSDAKFIADTYFSGAKVDLLGAEFETLITKNAQVAILLGQDYATANGTGA